MSLPAGGRDLIIDDTFDGRLAIEIRRRGRMAASLAELGFRGLQDVPLLQQLAWLQYQWLLVTADDAMPSDHRDTVARLGSTIATVDGRWKKNAETVGYLGMTQEQFKWETVQRWAHVMAHQPDGTIRRYSLTAHGNWTQRRR